MSTRISGRVNSAETVSLDNRISSLESTYRVLDRWGQDATATAQITGTGHSSANAQTSTMGGEVVSVGVEPSATDSELHIYFTGYWAATDQTVQTGLYYGTASHPIYANLNVVGSNGIFPPTSFFYIHKPGATATANVAIRLTGGGTGSITINSLQNGSDLGGQLNGHLNVLEYSATV